jgi:hypothetical protein
MKRTSKRSTRLGLEDLEGRQLLSTAWAHIEAQVPVHAHVAPAGIVHNRVPIERLTQVPFTQTTLTVTSQSAPAMTTFNGKTALAWTDLSHNLNIALLHTGTDLTKLPPFTYERLAAQSNVSPSLTVFGGRLYLAWAGTDGRLNVASSADGVHFANHVILGEVSTATPTMQPFNGRLDLAWTGTDGRLNLISSADGITFDHKVTLSQTSYRSVTTGTTTSFVEMTPALAVFHGQLWLAWTGSDAGHHLNTMISADGVHFGQWVTMGETSDDGPALTVVHGASSSQPDRLYLAWTGTGNRLLNIASTTTNAFGFAASTFSGATAYNGIALNSVLPGTVELAWTDVTQHIHILQE